MDMARRYRKYKIESRMYTRQALHPAIRGRQDVLNFHV